jgi:hypothetical protein
MLFFAAMKSAEFHIGNCHFLVILVQAIQKKKKTLQGNLFRG